MSGAYLVLSGVAKRFRDHAVIQGLDLTVAKGEFVSLLGPSGCGKTTLLRMIAGLVQCDAGRIEVGGGDLTRVPAHRRNVGVVFQNYALFPHLNVRDNVAFGLRAQGKPAPEVDAAVAHFLDLVRLDALGARPVGALSGGQQQRVALARALATRPKVLLLDESLSALDRKLRDTMRIELRRILRAEQITAIFVTHDQEEALVMSDRVAVMNAGRIEQFDAPDAVYARPATPFVLDFVGQSCSIEGRVTSRRDRQLEVDTPYGALIAAGDFQVGESVTIGVRPENVRLVDGDAPSHAAENVIRAQPADPVFLGSRRMIHFQCKGEDRLLAELPGDERSPLDTAQPVSLCWPVERTLAYRRDTPG